MKIPCQATALLFASFFLLHGAENAPRQRDGIDELIKNLASETFRVREDASRELWATGQAALEPLREAARSEDPERAMRAAEVVEKLELHITPTTSPEIVELIRRYHGASANLKVNFLNALKREKAYFQVLRLYATEDRPEVLAQLAPVIRGVAILGARQAILKDDTDMAIRLLEMSAGEPSDLMALACLYRALGELDEQLANPQAPAGVATELWKITMLRAKGDLEAAAELAKESKQTELLAGIRVLTGDPTLWLERDGLLDPTQQLHNDYLKISLKRWSGEKIPAMDFKELLSNFRHMPPRSEEHDQAAAALAALGKIEEIEAAMVKNDPLVAFQHFLSQERIKDAFKAMDLDPEEPDFKAWVAERFQESAVNVDDDDEDETPAVALAKLEMIAGFMESRGLHSELAAAFETPMREFAKRDENRFLDFLASLLQRGFATKYGALAASKWAGEDENRWDEVFAIAFIESEEVKEWLKWISEMDPELANPQKLVVMQALLQVGSDPEDLRNQWLARAWKAVDAAPQETKTEYLKRIITLAVSQEDVATSLKAWNMLEDKESNMWSSIDMYLSAAGNWKEAAELLDGNKKFSASSSPELHAYLAATLRKAGDEKRALIHDQWAEKLSLGYAPSCKRIGDYYTYGGDPKRAAQWYQRAAYQSDLTGSGFMAGFNGRTLDSGLLATFAASSLQQGNYQVAASCHEALMEIYASRAFVNLSSTGLARERMNADLAKALAILPQDRKKAIELLEEIHTDFTIDGALADHFFPLVKRAGLVAEHDRWFAISWEQISEVIEKYPHSDNTRNTAAWLASRAGLKLTEAKRHLEHALRQRPAQPAYMDTMAETHFAMGDRKNAIKWSDQAMKFYPLIDRNSDLMLRTQNYRFHHAPLPK